MATVETWVCPKCEWFYHSPQPVLAMSHKCNPKQMGQSKMRKFKEHTK